MQHTTASTDVREVTSREVARDGAWWRIGFIPCRPAVSQTTLAVIAWRVGYERHIGAFAIGVGRMGTGAGGYRVRVRVIRLVGSAT
ncbi:MAG: hypothetical protein ACYC0I_01550 [Acidimicrobiales bacterium]